VILAVLAHRLATMVSGGAHFKLQNFGVKNARMDHTILDAIVNQYNNLQAYSTMKTMVDNQQGLVQQPKTRYNSPIGL
jgi:hypothetical protein